mgnify:CR=1 FL=1
MRARTELKLGVFFLLRATSGPLSQDAHISTSSTRQSLPVHRRPVLPAELHPASSLPRSYRDVGSKAREPDDAAAPSEEEQQIQQKVRAVLNSCRMVDVRLVLIAACESVMRDEGSQLRPISSPLLMTPPPILPPRRNPAVLTRSSFVLRRLRHESAPPTALPSSTLRTCPPPAFRSPVLLYLRTRYATPLTIGSICINSAFSSARRFRSPLLPCVPSAARSSERKTCRLYRFAILHASVHARKGRGKGTHRAWRRGGGSWWWCSRGRCSMVGRCSVGMLAE